MRTPDGFDYPRQRYVVRGYQRWAMILTAAGLLGEEEIPEFLRRPFGPRGLRPVHAHWVKVGRPRPPGETGHDPTAWESFVAQAHLIRKEI